MSFLCYRSFLKIQNRFGSCVSFYRPVTSTVIKVNETQKKHRKFSTNCFRKHTNETSSKNGQKYADFSSTICVLACGIGVAIAFHLVKEREKVNALNPNAERDQLQSHNIFRKDLPIYSMNEVSKHTSSATEIWITYGIGVYNITKFVPEHPGGDKILIGAGSSIDPFWHIYQQHNTPQISSLLESFRIGNLLPEDDIGTQDLSDAWSNEPKRHASLTPTSLKPFNAEPPPSLLVEHFLTPNDFFYVRNHLPVPDIDVDDYELEIEIEGSDQIKTLTLEDIQNLPKHNVTAAIMCGGNRRSEMTRVKPVKGLSWGQAAVGNAIWSGPKLRDILKEIGIESDEKRHVHFEGYDIDPMSTHYAASIPLSKAMDERGDVILAYEMNGQPLPRDHGFPVRAICPGIVGARNVKWLARIIIAEDESDSHWQQNDYKGFSPSTDWDTVDFSKSPAIQNMPVTSAICSPGRDEDVSVNERGCIKAKGYAWSGGGNKIVRVDLTADGGKTWHVAELKHETSVEQDQSNPNNRNWAWCLWTAEIPIAEGVKNVEIWAKAVDSNYNVQPESFENIWNLRGVLSNAYSRIQVNIV